MKKFTLLSTLTLILFCALSARADRVYFIKPDTWETVRFYGWSAEVEHYGALPGAEMELITDVNIWQKDINEVPEKSIFNNNDKPQTADLTYTPNSVYNVNGLADPYFRYEGNDWATLPACKLTTNEGVIYTIGNVYIEAGKNFKFADANWGFFNYGGPTDMAKGQTYNLTNGGGNCTVNESGNYKFEFNLATKQLSVKEGTSTGIDAINADTDAPVEYFSLQGIRVAEPQAGNLYIRRCGTAVAKVLF